MRTMLICAFSLAPFARAAGDGITAQVLTPVLEAPPRHTLSIRIRLDNQTDEWRTVEPQLAVPAGWLVLVPPARVRLDPGASQVLIMSVLVAADARAGDYTFPLTYYVSNWPGPRRALFTATVPAINRVTLRPVNEPEFVVSNEFETTFLLRNEGNTVHEWQLSASSSLGYRLRTVPEVVVLSPGENVEITALVAGRRPAQQASHALTMTAQSLTDPDFSATAVSRTVLIPEALPASSAFHTFPLRAKLSYQGHTAGRSSDEGPALELRGAGRLSEQSEGLFRVDLRLTANDLVERLAIGYRLPDFSLLVGDQTFTPSPLTPSLSGFGVSASFYTRLAADVPLAVEVQGYTHNETAGLTASLSSGPIDTTDVELTMNASNIGLLGSLAVAYSPNLRDPIVVQLSSLEATYGVRLPKGGVLSHGLEVEGQLSEGLSFVRLRLDSRSAGFDRNGDHTFAVSLGSLFRMNEALRIKPDFPLFLSARYASSWKWAPDLPFFFAPPSGARWSSEEYGLGVSFSAGRFSLAGSYSSTMEDRSDGIHDKDLVKLLGSYRAPSGFALAQSLEFEQLRVAAFATSHTLEFDTAAGIPTGNGGKLTVNLEGEHDLVDHELDDLAFGVNWTGRLAESLAVSSGATVHLVNKDKLWDAQLRTNYRFPDEHEFTADVNVKVTRDRPYRVHFEVSYSVPLNVPIGRRSNIGKLAGHVTTVEGAPVEGLIISVAGQALATSADGSFTFPSLPVGEHVVQVQLRDALAPDQLLTPAPPQRITIADRQEARIDFRVIQGSVVTGVLNIQVPERSASAIGDEESFEGSNRGVRVELRNSNGVLYALTDAGGTFSFERVPPGNWTIRVVEPSLSTSFRLEPDEQEIDLQPGERARVEFTLSPVVRRIEFNVEETLVPPSSK